MAPSAPSELAWVLNLLTQTARYADPALAELDANLLPGIAQLGAPTRERAARMWQDGQPGCTELLLCADQAGSLLDDEPTRLFSWLRSSARGATFRYELITENAQDRAAILQRLRRLGADARTRVAYLDLLVDVWSEASPAWNRRGRQVVGDACDRWKARLDGGASLAELVPPRHPLARADQPGLNDLFAKRGEFALSPLYFCTSGGHVVDLGEYVHIAVPASDLLPVRRKRDAAFVADRVRVLAEPTRVRILLEALSAPATVMELARSLRISQPTVSAHVKVLRDAGLIQPERRGGRSVFVASRKRVERLLEDARATIARWD